MSIHVCECVHNGRKEYHLRYPGLTKEQAQSIADRINSGALVRKDPAPRCIDCGAVLVPGDDDQCYACRNDEHDPTCPTCGAPDGGTSCGLPGCGLNTGHSK